MKVHSGHGNTLQIMYCIWGVKICMYISNQYNRQIMKEEHYNAFFLAYKHSSERTGLNMDSENTQKQLTFLCLLPCFNPPHSPPLPPRHPSPFYNLNPKFVVLSNPCPV